MKLRNIIFFSWLDQHLGVNQHLGVAPDSSRSHFYWIFIQDCIFLMYFSLFYGKFCWNTEKDDFDQWPACEATFHWSKYTTTVLLITILCKKTDYSLTNCALRCAVDFWKRIFFPIWVFQKFLKYLNFLNVSFLKYLE